MNGKIISEAMEFLDEDMIQHTASIRNIHRKVRAGVISRILVAAAVLAISGTVFAEASGGKFQDIENLFHIVTGTEYIQATDEIKASVVNVGENLTILVKFEFPNAIPYSELSDLGIASCQITDLDGTVIQKIQQTDLAKVKNGQITLTIPINGLDKGIYTLQIDQWIGNKAADQPLKISGLWECSFSVK